MPESFNLPGKVSLDSSDAEKAIGRLEQGGSRMAQTLGKAGEKAAQGVEAIGKSSESTAKKVVDANAYMTAAVKKLIAEQERLSAGPKGSSGFLEVQARQIGANVDALKPLLTQLDEMRQKNAAAFNGLADGAKGLDHLGMSAKQTANNLRMIGPQFTDIVTGLASGQKPLTVLIQQGGQLKDVFGGIGPAARAVGGYVMGMVNPLTIAAAAVAGIGYAFLQGAKEQREFQNALTLTGGVLGISTSGFAKLRDSLEGVAGTKGKAAEALSEIAKAGVFTADSVKGIAQAAVLMEKATGQSISKTVDQFKELAKAPADASAKLNEQYNYLTAAVYRQIKALEDQGRAVDAAKLAIDSFANSQANVAQRVIENAGFLETAWRGVETGAKKAWDAMLGVGRAETGAEQLARMKAQLASIESAKGTGPASNAFAAAQAASLREQIAYLERVTGALDAQAKARAENNQLQKLGIEFEKQGEQFETKKEKRERELNKARTEGQQLIRAGIITETQLQQRLNDIRKKYEEQPKKGPAVNAFDAQMLRDYAKGLDDLRGITLDADAKTESLSKTQAKLREIQASPTWAQFSRQQQEQIIYSAALAQASEDEAVAVTARAQAAKLAAAEYDKFLDSQYDLVAKTKAEIEAEQEHIASIGLSRIELANLAAAKLEAAAATKEKTAAEIEERDGDLNLARAYREQAGELRKLADLKRNGAIRETAAEIDREMQRVADSIYNGLSDSLYRGFEAGKNFFQSFWDGVKNTIKTTVLRVAVQGVMNASGIAGVLGQGSGLAGAVSGGSSLLGTGAFGSGFQSGLTAWTSGGSVTGVLGSALDGSLFAGGIANGLGALAGALGPIAIGVGLIMSLVKARGGPKDEGTYNYGTQGTQGSAAATIAQGIQQQYAGIASAIGLQTKSISGLMLAFAKDPKGTAQTQLDVAGSGYSRGGRLGGTENVGRSDEEFTAAVTEEAYRVIAATLSKQQDLNAVYKDWLATISNTTPYEEIRSIVDHITAAGTERAQLEARLFELTATPAEKLAKAREKERAAIDPTNLAILEQVYAQEDLQAAVNGTTDTLAQAVEKLRNPARTIQEIAQNLVRMEGDANSLAVQFMRANGDNAGADALQRKLDTAGFTDAEIALYDYNAALRKQIQAITDAKQALVDLGNSGTQAIANLASAGQSLESAKAALASYGEGLRANVTSLQDQINTIRGQALEAVKQATTSVQSILANMVTASQQAEQAVKSAISTAQGNLQALQSASTTAQQNLATAVSGVQSNLQALVDVNTNAAQALASATSTVQSNLQALVTANTAAQQALASAKSAVQQQLSAISGANDAAQNAVTSARTALQSALQGVASEIAQAAASVASAQDQLAQARASITAGYLSALDAENAVKKRITDAYLAAQDQVTQAQQRLSDLQKQAAEALRSAGNTILDTLRELAGSSAGSGNVVQQLKAQRNAFNALAARALSGDAQAAGQLGGAGKSLIAASRAGSSTADQVRADDLMVRQVLASVLAVTGSGTGAAADDPVAKAQEDLKTAMDKATAAQTLAIASGASLVASNEDLAGELAKAAIEVARWSSAVTTSGASRNAEQADLLGQYNTALAALGAAQDSQARLLAATGSLDLTGAQQSADSWSGAVLAAKTAQEGLTTAQTQAQAAAADLQAALLAAASAGVSLAGAKTPIEQLAQSITDLQDAQDKATTATGDLQAALGEAAALGISLSDIKGPLDVFRDSLEVAREAQGKATTAASDLSSALVQAAALGVSLADAKTPADLFAESLVTLRGAQIDATKAAADLQTGLTEAAAAGVTLGQLKSPLEVLRDSLADVRTAQDKATTAANDLATALTEAAAFGVSLADAKTPLDDLREATAKLATAQSDALLVNADLYDAGQGLVGQYHTLQTSLGDANDALAEFVARTAGLDLSPLQTVLDGLLTQYGTAQTQYNAAQAQIDIITAQINSTGYGAQINAAYSDLLGRLPDFEGLVYWFNKMVGGFDSGSVRSSIQNSPEYKLLNGLPAYAEGTMYVPRTGPALIHEGEMIVPRRFNPNAGALNAANDPQLLAEVQAMRSENRALLEAVANFTRKTASILDDTTQGGTTLRTTAVAA